MKIAAGIVTYNPSIERLKENIIHIINQVDILYIYDNASLNIVDIKNLIQDYTEIVLLKSDKNNGIAYALNVILENCIKDQISWFLTLDQDSVCPNNLIDAYLAYVEFEDIGMMTLQVKVQDRIIQSQQTHHDYEFVSKCITSASFVNSKICESIGGFDNTMFIDCVDHEFSKRMVLNGFKILKVNTVYLEHELGSSTPIKITVIFNKIFKTKVLYHSYSPFRVYYLIRNNLYYLRKFKGYLTKEENNYSIKTILGVSRKAILLEKKKMRYFTVIMRGFYDGITMNVNLFRPTHK